MIEFLDGGGSVASAAVALFFLRYWRRTGDRLFGMFALAFAVFAVNRIALAAIDDASEAETFVYAARAVAFALLLAGIVDKNRSPR